MIGNSKIATLGARLVEPNQKLDRRQSKESDDDDDDDAILAELEAEIENDDSIGMREQGFEAIKREMEKMKEMRDNQYGAYSEESDEKEVVRITAREKRCVVHFYHSNFKRCEIMDKHLTKLAPKYFHTRFLRVFVENIPWLVERLSIKVLPCVICFVDGVSRDRLVGFEELGNDDNFNTAVLELRLLNAGVVERPKANAMDTVYKVTKVSSGDDEEFDL